MFCDEDGIDVIPIQMVNVLETREEDSSIQEPSKDQTIKIELNHVKIENEVSTLALSSVHETQREKYHDALDELDEIDPLEIDGTKTYPLVFKTKERAKLDKPLRLMHIEEQNETTILSPHIQVECGTLGVSTIALIDTRAHANTISHDLWVQLGKPHIWPTQQVILIGFLGQVTTMLGKCRLPIYICGYNCVHEFHVFLENATNTQIILGQPRQR